MICYLSLGANLGHRARQLAQAISALATRPELLLRRISPVYETVPVGYAPGPDNPRYLNLTLELEANCSPRELLDIAHEIENALGRERSFPNAPRTIDVDLLACGGIIVTSKALTLPHPRLGERQFVLAPLADIAPEFAVGAQSTARALANPDDPEIVRLGPLGELVRSGL